MKKLGIILCLAIMSFADAKAQNVIELPLTWRRGEEPVKSTAAGLTDI